MPFPESGISLVADLQNYSRNINQAIEEAGQLDSTLADLASTVDSIGSDVDLSVAVDIEEGDFATLESDLETFDGSEYEATATAETTGEEEVDVLSTDLENLEGTEAEATATAETTGEDEVSALETELTNIDGMDANAEVNVETPDPAANETLGLLKDIRAGVIFTILLNVAGTILDVFNAIQEFTVDPILDVEDAVAQFNARTGESIEGVDDLINRLHFVGDVGDFGPITDTLVAAQQQGIEFGEGMEEAAFGALAIAKVFEDQNPVEVLRTMNQLVGTGLAPDFQTAADVITAGLQEGNNRGGDMLQTLNQFAPMFSEMGIDASEAMSLFSSGLDAGFRSTSDISRAIDTMNKNITGAPADSPVAEALESIGVELPAAGEQVGEDFFNAVVEGIQKNPEAADVAIEAIFGGRADKVSEAFGELTLSDEAFDNLEARADEAATAIDDSLRGAIADFILFVQSEINEFLVSADIDLPGKIEDLKEGLQAALDALATGESLGMALEVGLQVPGLNDTFDRIASGFGNFEIVLLQVVASLANLIPSTGAGAVKEDALAEVARLGAAQFTFDVQLQTDAEGIQSTIQTALSRGVDPGVIGANLRTAIDEAIIGGDFANARLIATGLGDTLGTPFQEELQAVVDHAIQSAQFDFEQAFAAGDVAGALNIAEGLDDPALITAAQGLADTFQAQFESAFASGDQSLALQFAEALGDQELIARAEAMATSVDASMETVATSAEDASTRVGNAVSDRSIVPDMMKVSEAARIYLPIAGNEIINMGILAEEGFSHASYWALAAADSFNTLGNTLPILQGINAELSAMATLGTTARNIVESIPTGTGGGGGNTNNSNTTVNVNQTNNVQSNAQAASISQSTSRGVRGLAA